MKTNNILEKEYIDKGYWKDINLGNMLRKWSRIYSEKIAVVDGDTRITYKQLNQKADKLVKGFKKLGLKKGDKVVLQLPNSLSFVVISFAFFKMGVIPIMALPAHRETELKGIFETSKATTYIIKDKHLGYDYRDLARNLKRENSKIDKVIVDGEEEEFIPLKSLISNDIFVIDDIVVNDYIDDNSNVDERIDFKDIAFLLLSGGTTGIPKLIPRRHTDYLYVAETLAHKCKMDENSVYLAVLPIAHNFPLGCPGMIGTFSVGGTLVMCKAASPDEILPLIEEERVTMTALVPALASICLEFLELENDFDISSLKLIQIGGSVLDSVTAHKVMNSFNCTLQQVYGITEGLICCTSIDDTKDIICNCQGKPISLGDEVRIVNENGEDVKKGEVGELIVRGPYTILGYYNLPRVNKKCFTNDGYYCTGDKAYITYEGNYQIVGRIKEQINRAGEKITPSELEELLSKHEMIKEASVVGIKDSSLGERICAFIITDNKKLNINEIRKFLRTQGLATFKMPDQVEVIKSWPLTSVGKINKEKLKNLATKDYK